MEQSEREQRLASLKLSKTLQAGRKASLGFDLDQYLSDPSFLVAVRLRQTIEGVLTSSFDVDHVSRAYAHLVQDLGVASHVRLDPKEMRSLSEDVKRYAQNMTFAEPYNHPRIVAGALTRVAAARPFSERSTDLAMAMASSVAAAGGKMVEWLSIDRKELAAAIGKSQTHRISKPLENLIEPAMHRMGAPLDRSLDSAIASYEAHVGDAFKVPLREGGQEVARSGIKKPLPDLKM